MFVVIFFLKSTPHVIYIFKDSDVSDSSEVIIVPEINHFLLELALQPKKKT